MRIGINVGNLIPQLSGGMEWYVRCLVRELGRIDQDNEYVLVTGFQNHHLFTPPSPRWKCVLYGGRETGAHVYRETPEEPPEPPWWYRTLRKYYRMMRRRPVAQCRRLSELLQREKIDVWFCPFMFYLPFDTDVPVVHTIADLQHEHHPDFFTEVQLATRTLGYQFSCKASAATIAISHFVADDIKRLYGIDGSRVFAIPLALDPHMEGAAPRAERLSAQARLKYRLHGDYIFFPANGWAHKNHETLVRAMRHVAKKAPGVRLVLSGFAYDLLDRIQPILDEHGLHDVVRYVGYVTRDDLVGLYAGSKMLVFPSLFEGFGLPLLEAMHLGVPVACSRMGSLPEVAGDATLFFDPRDDGAIADAILRILGESGLRERLADAGHAQVARFSYARTAQETLGVFRRVHAGELPRPNLPTPRPLAPGKLLQDGRCRWFFRHTDLRELRVEAAPANGVAGVVGASGTARPTAAKSEGAGHADANGSSGQAPYLEILLDGERVLTAPLPRRGSREYVIKPVAGRVASAVGPAAVDGSVGTAVGKDFHALEIVASGAGSTSSSTPAVQINQIIALDSAARKTRLVA